MHDHEIRVLLLKSAKHIVAALYTPFPQKRTRRADPSLFPLGQPHTNNEPRVLCAAAAGLVSFASFGSFFASPVECLVWCCVFIRSLLRRQASAPLYLARPPPVPARHDDARPRLRPAVITRSAGAHRALCAAPSAALATHPTRGRALPRVRSDVHAPHTPAPLPPRRCSTRRCRTQPPSSRARSASRRASASFTTA